MIGADGFGFANEKGVYIKIPQTGGVAIGDDVEIGANTTIDRGALSRYGDRRRRQSSGNQIRRSAITAASAHAYRHRGLRRHRRQRDNRQILHHRRRLSQVTAT